MLARQPAEPARPARIKLEPDGRLEPVVDVGPDLLQIFAGHFLPGLIEVAEDPGLGPARGDLFLADDRVVRAQDCWDRPL